MLSFEYLQMCLNYIHTDNSWQPKIGALTIEIDAWLPFWAWLPAILGFGSDPRCLLCARKYLFSLRTQQLEAKVADNVLP